ncbi:MAG TPA: hypothetical protein VKM54_27540 [Myxococcota bacterium]|nr:hypothetical protein [Myxococcota bacterium]
MSSRTSVKEILRFLGVDDAELLPELRREGLFEAEELSPEEAEELRMAATLIRELGVNPAGVDIILHMRRRLLFLEERMRETLRRLLEER